MINEKTQVQLSVVNFLGTLFGAIATTVAVLMFLGVIPVKESSASEYVTEAEFRLNATYTDKRIDETGVQYYQLQRSIERLEKKIDELIIKK